MLNLIKWLDLSWIICFDLKVNYNHKCLNRDQSGNRKTRMHWIPTEFFFFFFVLAVRKLNQFLFSLFACCCFTFCLPSHWANIGPCSHNAHDTLSVTNSFILLPLDELFLIFALFVSMSLMKDLKVALFLYMSALHSPTLFELSAKQWIMFFLSVHNL